MRVEQICSCCSLPIDSFATFCFALRSVEHYRNRPYMRKTNVETTKFRDRYAPFPTRMYNCNRYFWIKGETHFANKDILQYFLQKAIQIIPFGQLTFFILITNVLITASCAMSRKKVATVQGGHVSCWRTTSDVLTTRVGVVYVQLPFIKSTLCFSARTERRDHHLIKGSTARERSAK